ncbi:MAG: glycosyltransferase family 2 protein [Alphaproteobacteria bacterium]
MISLATIVVPTFGRPAALTRCLEGLGRQSPEAGAFEVLVVDDGSPVPVNPEFPSGRFTLRVLRQANAGPGAARNVGAREAQGEIVAFTDDDCVPDPGWLAAIASAVRGLPGALAGGATRNGLGASLCTEVSHLVVSVSQDFHDGLPGGPRFFPSNNMACRREDFLRSGGFDPAFRLASEDREFCDRWRMQGRPLVRVPGATIAHFHEQDLAEFLRLHLRYGRGAYRYHALRRARGSGSLGEEVGFHASFVPRFRARAAAEGRGAAWQVRAAALLLAWQGANALGFVAEWLQGRSPSTGESRLPPGGPT